MYLQIKFIWAKIMYFHSLLILVYHSSCSHLNSPRAWMGFCPPKWCDTNQTAPRTSNILVYSRKQAKWKKDNNQWCTNPNPDFIWIRCKSNVGTSFFYTLYKKPPDLGLCLELCQHCACFHVHVFVQVRGIQEVGYFCIIPAGNTMSMFRSWTWPHSGQEAFWSVYIWK